MQVVKNNLALIVHRRIGGFHAIEPQPTYLASNLSDFIICKLLYKPFIVKFFVLLPVTDNIVRLSL